MRGRGKEEYKYVSGDTSEHGGELESQKKVLPLYSRVSEDSLFFSPVNLTSCILLVLNSRRFIKIEAKSILLLSEGAEVMRKNVSVAKKRKQKKSK